VDDALYDEVDEQEYDRIRRQRIEGDNFIVDDDDGVDYGYQCVARTLDCLVMRTAPHACLTAAPLRRMLTPGLRRTQRLWTQHLWNALRRSCWRPLCPPASGVRTFALSSLCCRHPPPDQTPRVGTHACAGAHTQPHWYFVRLLTPPSFACCNKPTQPFLGPTTHNSQRRRA
jgi:hypothetical protein